MIRSAYTGFKQYIFTYLLPFFLSALLSACAVHQAPLQEVDERSNARIQAKWDARKQVLSSIESWHLKGKIAVKAGS